MYSDVDLILSGLYRVQGLDVNRQDGGRVVRIKALIELSTNDKQTP